MASPRAATGPDVVVTPASSPAADGEPSRVAVASHGHYSKQPRDHDTPAPPPPQPAPPMMGYGYEPAIALHCLADQPAVVDCPFCGHRVQTQVEDNDSHMTILSGIGIGFLCPCLACLPCCLGWFPDVDHYCPACQQRVAHVPYNLPAQVIAPAAPGTMMRPPPPPPPPPPPHPRPQDPPYAAAGPGYPPMRAAPAPQPPAPPQLARYA